MASTKSKAPDSASEEEAGGPSSRRLRVLVGLVMILGLGAAAVAAAVVLSQPRYQRPPSFPGNGTVAGRPIEDWIADLRSGDPARRSRGLGVLPAVFEIIEGPGSHRRYWWFGDYSGLLHRDLEYFFPEAMILVAAAPDSLAPLLSRFDEPQPVEMDNPMTIYTKTLVEIGDPRVLERLVVWLEERRDAGTWLAGRMVEHAVMYLSEQTEERNAPASPTLSRARLLGPARRWLEAHPEVEPL